MGTVYRVFCHDCRTFMDVDKLDRRTEMKLRLADFMLNHNRHKTMLIDDGDDDAWGSSNQYYDLPKDQKYKEEPNPDA